jgi:hypothetical protein
MVRSVSARIRPAAGAGPEKTRTNPALIFSPATTFSLFGGVQDNSGNNLLLLVDTTNPLVPVVTPYSIPVGATNFTAVGTLLHVSAGAAGYAVYQIPGVTPTQFGLTGACVNPVTWTLNPPTLGTLSASGLYTAPASVIGGQTAAVTATNQVDTTETASATVNLSQALTLTLTASTPGPYVLADTVSFVVTAANPAGPVSGVSVSFAVTGANPRTVTAVTDSNGHATLSYAGTARGMDTIQGSSGGSISNSLSILWVNPSNAISTTAVSAEFFISPTCASGCEPFSIAATQVPAFVQAFPNILFDPSPALLGVGNTTRPFTDIVLDPTGAPTGTIVAQGSGLQAGVGTMAGFSAVFQGTFVVTQAGNYTFNVVSADGFILGMGNGAMRVSGADGNAPASSVFASYPVMGANNAAPTGGTYPIAVNFPAAGSYPYEVDYRSGTGGALSLAVTVTHGGSTFELRPLMTLELTPATVTQALTGHAQSLTLTAKDETGAGIPQLPLTVTVSGANTAVFAATTNSSGVATISYTGSNSGTDLVQVSATDGGQALYSNRN